MKAEGSIDVGSVRLNHPFGETKVPVCNGLPEFTSFVEQYPDFYICPYVADKSEEAWDVSTSRVYMNQVLPNLLYVPVNIQRDDSRELQKFFSATLDNQRIAAINITQPHKNSPTIRQIFQEDEAGAQNTDTLIRDKEGLLRPLSINAAAFVGWFKETIGTFEGSTVVLVGVGGAGEPIVRLVANESPARILLIDPEDKSELAGQIQRLVPRTSYNAATSAVEVDQADDSIVVINAAGKEGADDQRGMLSTLLANVKSSDKIFVDIRPQLNLAIVDSAKKHGWRAFTGNGMNARNDYVLLEGIANYINSPVPSLGEFTDLVAAAS